MGTRDLGHILHVTLGKSLHPSGSRLFIKQNNILCCFLHRVLWFSRNDGEARCGFSYVNFRYLEEIQVMALIYTGMLTSHLSKYCYGKNSWDYLFFEVCYRIYL